MKAPKIVLALALTGLSLIGSAALTATPKKLSKQDLGLVKKSVERYINEITNKGSYGTYFFCSQHKEFETYFIAPKSAKILNVTEGRNNIAIAKIQLDSSDSNYSPIRANWSIHMDKERKAVRARYFPGGWCIRLISRD